MSGVIISDEIITAIHRLKLVYGSNKEVGEKLGISEKHVGQILAGNQQFIREETWAKMRPVLSKLLPKKEADSVAFVEDPAGPEYAADVWAELARWGRSENTSAKAKATVLATAELGGFAGKRLASALNALSTASSQEDEDAEQQPAVA